MRSNDDTIAALATPAGTGGIAIVRISGPDALSILKRVFFPLNTRARFIHAHMLYGLVKDEQGQEIDEAMAVYFASPRSYTREDVCEIHTHGGISASMTLERVINAGARCAERGEFTYRAFVNGRIDLSRAEAVMQLVSASGEKSARAAVRQLRHGVSSRIGACRKRLLALTALIDAQADFPDEMDESTTNAQIFSEARSILSEIKRAADPRAARIISDGARVVIAGRPNVGKSSLMNALVSSERSIVTDIPGTTRDTVNAEITLRGLRVTLTDTAGIRETGDSIEKIGVSRARESIDGADCVVLVTDENAPLAREDTELISAADERYIIVSNKTDLTGGAGAYLPVSALTGAGLKALEDKIYEIIKPDEDDEKLMSLRHVECAARAQEALSRLLSLPENTYTDLLRQDITDALDALGEITGENMTESAIDGIFERFCVGK